MVVSETDCQNRSSRRRRRHPPFSPFFVLFVGSSVGKRAKKALPLLRSLAHSLRSFLRSFAAAAAGEDCSCRILLRQRARIVVGALSAQHLASLHFRFAPLEKDAIYPISFSNALQVKFCIFPSTMNERRRGWFPIFFAP